VTGVQTCALPISKFPGILSDWGVRLRVCTSRYSIVFALKIMCSQLPGASSNEAPFFVPKK